MPEHTEKLLYLIDFLQKKASQVQELELQGNHALYIEKDIPLYKALMKEKALLLSHLYDECLPLMQGILKPHATRIINILHSFSQSALTALSLDSVFFMSALLYPDNHIQGTPDSLERLISTIKGLIPPSATLDHPEF